MDNLGTGQVGQLQIQHDDIGPHGPGDPNGLGPFPNGGHNVIPGFGKIPSHPVPPHGMVINNHHPHGPTPIHPCTITAPQPNNAPPMRRRPMIMGTNWLP